jgi:hypothetical protein
MAIAGFAWADESLLFPDQDTAIYENSEFDLRANGSGDFLFAGRTGEGSNSIRRGLVRFDLAQDIPAGATIDNVTLSLNMSKTIFGAVDVSLHPVTTDWGEGASDMPGQEGGRFNTPPEFEDATWIHSFFDSSKWQTPGGDFVDLASDIVSVGGLGRYEWSSERMIQDVQTWLDNPQDNFGWMLLGDEQTPTSAKRFDSRSHPISDNWPMLTIEFSPGEPSSDLTNNGTVDFQDLTILLASWNTQVGPEDGNLVLPETTVVNFADLTVLLADWGPVVAPSPEAALANAVPEPSTFALALIAGLTGLFFRRRR